VSYNWGPDKVVIQRKKWQNVSQNVQFTWEQLRNKRIHKSRERERETKKDKRRQRDVEQKRKVVVCGMCLWKVSGHDYTDSGSERTNYSLGKTEKAGELKGSRRL